MATYTHSVTQWVRHAWHVPGATYGSHGAAVAELLKAVEAARQEYTRLHGAEPFYDDWLRVYAADDEVVLFFEVDSPVVLPDIQIKRAGGQLKNGDGNE